MFEYKISFQTKNSFKNGNFDIQNYLNEMGIERWELVHINTMNFIDMPNEVANYTFFFKRKIIKSL
jgi:hypothetical protein